jgi:hypothetical protein
VQLVAWLITRLATRLVTPLVVDYSASRKLVVDYFTYAAHLGSSARHPAHRLSSTTSPTPCDRVPRHVARLVVWLVTRLVTRLVAPLVVDYSASRRLIIDYFTYAARLGASARHPAHRLSSTTSPTPRDQVPRHVARLIVWLVAQLITRLVAPLVVDYSASRRLIVDYFAYAVRLGASARRAAHRLSSTTSPTPRDRVPRHVAWLVARLVAWLVASLVVDYSALRRLVVDYFAYASCLGALACRAIHRLSSTTSPTSRDLVPRHIERLVAWLVAPLVDSVMVERVALLCVLTVRCTAWMNFVYSSCHRGAVCCSSVVPRLPPCFGETRKLSASSKSSMMVPLMIVSSWGRYWWLSSSLLLH